MSRRPARRDRQVVGTSPIPDRRLNTERLPFDAEHMLERDRLFLLIVLGETVLATSTAIAAAPMSPITVMTGTAGGPDRDRGAVGGAVRADAHPDVAASGRDAGPAEKASVRAADNAVGPPAHAPARYALESRGA